MAVGHGDAGHELVLAVVAGDISTNKEDNREYTPSLVMKEQDETVIDPPRFRRFRRFGRFRSNVGCVLVVPDGNLLLGELRVQVKRISPVVLDKGYTQTHKGRK